MSWIGDAVTGGITGLGNAINSVSQSWFGSKLQRDQADANYNAATQSQYAAEYAVRYQRTWWDSLVDGVNRLVRPLFAYSVIGLFVYCMVDPAAFGVRMNNLALVPEAMWVILGTIIAFYFGTRHLEMKAKAPNASTVKAVLDADRAIKQVANEEPSATTVSARVSPDTVLTIQKGGPTQESDSAYKAEMANDKPLSNSAIAEWNRRQRMGQAAQAQGG